MKRSQLAQIIKEEIQSLIKETTYNVKTPAEAAALKGKLNPEDEVNVGQVTEDEEYDDDEKKAHKAATKGTGGKEAKGASAEHTAEFKKQEELKSIKKELKKNSKEIAKIAKISKPERTKADQSLLDDMMELTKKKKKLESQI
tara:strand:- start:368 stop:796 length:429 start_codon:yes stop_codon:yes gene_type:complete